MWIDQQAVPITVLRYVPANSSVDLNQCVLAEVKREAAGDE